jgi:hypothetical protein
LKEIPNNMEDGRQDDLESRICGALPLKDIELFAILLFELNRGNEVKEKIARFAQRGYPPNLEGVSKAMRGHLNGCYTCNEVFTEIRDIWEAPLKLQFYSDPAREAAHARNGELHKWFIIEHLPLGKEEAENLRTYIRERYRTMPEATPCEPIKKYDEHISGCGFCTEYVENKKLIRERGEKPKPDQ